MIRPPHLAWNAAKVVLRWSAPVLGVALLALFVRPDSASMQPGPTRYVNRVDPTCGGHAPCYTTIQSAVNAALPGETIVIQAGTYREQVTIQGKNNVAAASEVDRIVITSDPLAPPGGVVITGTTSGCTNGHAIRLQQSKYVTLRGLTITGAGGQAIALLGGNNQSQAIHVERNRIFGNGGNECNGGITVNRGNPGTLIVNNLIYNNGRNGIAFLDADGGPHYLVQNTIHGNAWSGVSVARSHEIFLVNNAITGNGVATGSTGGRFGVSREASTSPQPAGIHLLNNLICGNRLGEIDGPALDGTDTGNLTPSGSEGPGIGASAGCQTTANVYAHVVGTDGLAGNADDDFTPASTSPVIDRGLDPRTQGFDPTLDPLFTADFVIAGTRPRPGTASGPTRFDIGAIEAAVPDSQGPTVTILQPAAGAVVRQSVTVAAEATDSLSGVASLALVVDGQPLAATLTPTPPGSLVAAGATWNTTTVIDGAHTLSAVAADRAGNGGTATRVVTVDNTAPDTQITIGPSGEIADTSATFTFTGTDNLTPTSSLLFAWRLDGSAFGPFSSAASAVVSALGEGSHTFEAKARDLAGNEDPTPARQTFTVSVRPRITSVSPATGPRGTLVTVTGSGFLAGATQVTFDGVAAIVRSVTPTTLTTTVPIEATTGPLTVTTALGTATSPQPFTVTVTEGFAVQAVPAAAQLLQGTSTTLTVSLSNDGDAPFTGLATLAVTGLPVGVTARFSPAATTSGGQPRTLTLTAAPSAAIGLAPLTIAAAAAIDGAPVTRTAGITLTVAAGGRTAALGQITFVDGTPIAGVRLTLGGVATASDAGGNFRFLDVPPGTQMLGIDANAAQSGLPIYAVDVTLTAGQATQLAPFRITPPPPPERFVPIANAGADQVISDARYPGVSITLPAGVTITGWDGTVKTRVAIERLSPDALPVPPPPGATRSLYQLFFGTPMGGLPSAPLPLTLPNDQELEPGEKAEIWYYDAAPLPGVPSGWRLAGLGTVSADGSRVVSDPGVGISRFCGVCGTACIIRNVDKQANVNPRGPKAGEPVDLGTGLMVVDKTDLMVPGRLPALLRRSYNAEDPFGRIAGFELATGPGWTLSIDVVLLQESPALRRLILPGNARFTFALQPDGTFNNSTFPDFAGAVLTSQSDGHTLRFKDGTTWRFATGYVPRVGLPIPILGLNLLVAQNDRNGNILSITRDQFGAPVRSTGPAGRALSFTVDAVAIGVTRLLSATDPIGRTVRYGYSTTAPFRLETVTDPIGGVTRYTYNAAGGIASITDPRDVTFLTNEYDGHGRVVRQTQADGGVWTFGYTGPFGAHTTANVTDPRGHVTIHRIDNAGFETETIDALGQLTRHERDAAGRVTATTDALGRITRFAYDAAGNLTRTTDASGNVTTYTYDSTFNRVTSITDPLGRVTRLEYDATGNLTATVDPLGQRTTFAYDGAGQPIATTDPLGNVTRFEYDPAGNLTATVDPLGQRTIREYDTASRLARQLDALGHATTIGYDAHNRIETVVDPLGGLTRFGHDPNGNLLTITDARGSVTTHAYDAMDRLTTRTDPVGATESFGYNTMGNLIRHVDRKGQAATFAYDPLNRRTRSSYADATVDLAYDGAGRLVRASDSSVGAILNQYDALDRLVGQTTSLGVITYQYDASGRRTTMTAPAQSPVTYTYDAASRVTSIAQAGQLAQFEYDTAGRRTRLTLPNEVSTEYQYDPASRVAALTYRAPSGPLGDLTYQYDPTGNRLSIGGSFARTLLPATVAAATHDPANRQLTFGPHTMTYDANGNLLTDGTNTYTWDARNRLSALSGSSRTAAFGYDALDRRARKTIAGTETGYNLDSLNPVQVVSSTGRVTNLLTGLGIDEFLVAQEATDRRNLLTDALGSTIAEVDAAGAVLAEYTYEPFGQVLATGATPHAFQYTARENDGTGLYYYRARYYSPTMQRFVGEDPLPPQFRARRELNAYAYVANNPLLFTDPFGLLTLPGTGYCGPGGSGPVMGQVDACCHDHDNCYGALGITAVMNVFGPPRSVWTCRDRCDEELCRCLANTNPQSGDERLARSLVRWQFGCSANGQLKRISTLGTGS